MQKVLALVAAGVMLAACSTTTTIQDAASPSPMVSPEADNTMMVAPSPTTDDAMEGETSKMLKTITLTTQNNLGQSGTATLTEENGQVKVVLVMKGGTFTAPQPAHIHEGSCPNPGAVKYPLSNVVNGESETVLNVTMDAMLKSAAKLAINVHKSASEASVYTACGNIQ